MRRYSRVSIALLLTVIYTMIIMSPLAPFVLKSPRLAHAITGECSGDCDICGCSLERRADRTCCCWQKKMQHEHDQEKGSDCCNRKKADSKPVLKCSCPCGGSKQFGLSGAGKHEQIPWQFTAGILIPFGEPLPGDNDDLLTDRCGDPPDPPPKLFFPV